MTDRVGEPDWDTTVLARPIIVDPDPSGRAGLLAATAAAYLAGRNTADGDDPARTLGVAGAVAVRSPAGILEVHETLDGWQLVASATPTADLADLAGAAIVRAARLADARRRIGAQR
jgi:hypothetical protein